MRKRMFIALAIALCVFGFVFVGIAANDAATTIEVDARNHERQFQKNNQELDETVTLDEVQMMVDMVGARTYAYAKTNSLLDELKDECVKGNVFHQFVGELHYNPELHRVEDAFGNWNPLSPPPNYRFVQVTNIAPDFKQSFKVTYENGDVLYYGLDAMVWKTEKGGE